MCEALAHICNVWNHSPLDFNFMAFDFRISSDHNIDNTSNVLLDWVNKTKSLYHNVHIEVNEEPQAYDWESGPIDWPEERFLHLIQLRQTALQEARRQWADYLFVSISCFVFLPCSSVGLCSPSTSSLELFTTA